MPKPTAKSQEKEVEQLKYNSFANLGSLVPCISWAWESVLEDMKSREDIEYDYLCKITANKAHYLNQVEWLIADNISE